MVATTDLRGAAPRQADGRAADLLGSVRQCAAHRRDRARRATRDLRVRGWGADRARRPPAGGYRLAGRLARISARACRAGREPPSPPSSSSVWRPARRQEPDEAGRVAAHAPRPGAVAPAAAAAREGPNTSSPSLARSTARSPRQRPRAVEDQLVDVHAERARLPGRCRSDPSASGRPRIRSTAAASSARPAPASQSTSRAPAPQRGLQREALGPRIERHVEGEQHDRAVPWWRCWARCGARCRAVHWRRTARLEDSPGSTRGAAAHAPACSTAPVRATRRAQAPAAPPASARRHSRQHPHRRRTRSRRTSKSVRRAGRRPTTPRVGAQREPARAGRERRDRALPEEHVDQPDHDRPLDAQRERAERRGVCAAPATTDASAQAAPWR